MTASPIIPQRNVPIQDPESPSAFSLPWYRYLQQIQGEGPVDLSALEAEIAAVADEVAGISITANAALTAATTALSEADSALLIALVDLGQTDG